MCYWEHQTLALALQLAPGSFAYAAVAAPRPLFSCRCGNVAAILELDEHLNKSFKVSHVTGTLQRMQACSRSTSLCYKEPSHHWRVWCLFFWMRYQEDDECSVSALFLPKM